jgi:hypothetical protein
MENRVLSREEIEAEIKRFDRKIYALTHGAVEITADWHVAMKHYKGQREVLVNYLEKIDSTDAF